MFLKNINLVNFRNYDNVYLELNPGINIIYGENAQGKTNLLESIYFLALTKSHRSLNDISLIKNNCISSKITGCCNINEIDNNFEIVINKTNKKCKIDNKEIKILSEYISNIKVIIFFPEDLDLIKSSPDVRRRYINIQISQLDKNYFKVLSNYNKLLKIRNGLLKDYLKNKKIDDNYFEIITDYLIENAIYIYIMRKKYIDKINEYAKDIYKNISGYNDFFINYKINSDLNITSKEEIKVQLINKFKDIYEVEKKTGTTMIGPHRDDIEFILSGKNLKLYGSQGQQRMAVISLKLAEISIFKKYNDDYPILLLDDVFSELDDFKKNNLLNYIKGDIQTIITTTELTNLDDKILKNAKLINIKDGLIIN